MDWLAERLTSIEGDMWFNLLSIGVAIFAIIIATIVSYHIARRQGAFRASRLHAEFLPGQSHEITTLIFAIESNKATKVVVPVPFLIHNKQRFPVTNVSVQFNLYPKRGIKSLEQILGPMYADSIPQAHIYSMADRDIIELRLDTLAPEEGTVLFVPYILDSRQLGLESLGKGHTFLFHAEGPKLEKTIYIGAIAELNEGSETEYAEVLAPILEKLSGDKIPKLISLLRASYRIVFRVPVYSMFWAIVHVKSEIVEKGIALSTELTRHELPTISAGQYESHLSGISRPLALVVVIVSALSGAFLIVTGTGWLLHWSGLW